MAREQNFLLGKGEQLATTVHVPKGGNSKNPPYDLGTAKARISSRLVTLDAQLKKLPDDACPHGEAVAVVTLHPRYLSKSDYPSDLFAAVGLRAIGSRSRRIKPESWGIQKHDEEALTEDIFVAGKKSAFHSWAKTLPSWTETSRGAGDLSHVEDLKDFDASSKLRGIVAHDKSILLEIVLHNSAGADIIPDFARYAKANDAELLITHRRDIQGLTFIPLRVDSQNVENIARFSFVRVARGMPTLRPFRPNILRSNPGFDVEFPSGAPIDSVSRCVIFDGGLPPAAQIALKPWVDFIEPSGLGPAVPSFEEHGLAVTTAFLFGPLDPAQSLNVPICPVDHVRILDDKVTSSWDPNYYNVLNRILGHLDAHPKRYSLVNLSLGPSLAVDDDDVTLWTAELDRRFAGGQCVTTVAAGNDGELDEATGLNRIQPPADGVNVLSVGSADRLGSGWERAAYSCIGPGRCPGVVKPDGLAFGGSSLQPFGVLTPTLRGGSIMGTSFAAPFALRSAASIMAQMGSQINPLTVRALLIHRADRQESHKRKQVGWGRFESDPSQLITCDDDEALILFQGVLPVGEHLRAPIPINNVQLSGKIKLAATLIIAPEVDPAHPGSYTRSGLEVTFRPHSGRYAPPRNGKQPNHPKTRSFFSPTSIYFQTESILREGGHKWEPCLHHERNILPNSLFEPCFDIYYHHRANGKPDGDPQPIRYAFVVGIKAPKVRDFYNQVVRAYAAILIPLQPQTRIQFRTWRP